MPAVRERFEQTSAVLQAADHARRRAHASAILEVRVPISPRPAWLNRSRLLAASIREFYPSAIMRFYIGQPGGPTPEAVQLCDAALKGFGIEWIGRTEFDAWEGSRAPYLATMNRRWKPPFDGDHILMLDADVLCLRRFDQLFEANAVQGVQAHVPPLSAAQWRHLFWRAGMDEPALAFPHSGAGIMCAADAVGPWYPNSGVVFGPRALVERMAEHYQQAIQFLGRAIEDGYWNDQIANTLAAYAAQVPMRALPISFNFPNQREFDAAYPTPLDDVRFVHYLRTDTIDRDRDFANADAIRALAGRCDLTGSNEVLRARVAQLVGRVAA